MGSGCARVSRTFQPCFQAVAMTERRLAKSQAPFYRIGDLLWRHRAAIQRELFNRERSLRDIPDTIAFYDLTNVHYHGQTDGELPRFGRSKQKRDDCPLITLALELDGAGSPCSCEILPGNVSEPGTLKDALARLEAVCGGTAPKPTVVMDAGIATEENIAWLSERGYDCIAVSRSARPAPPEGGPEALLITSARHEVRAWRFASEDGEARLYVVSEGKKKAESAMLGLRRNRFEAALERLHSGLPVKGRLKPYDKVLESVGRLKQRFSAVAKHYEITVEKADTGPNASAVRFKRRPQYDKADEAAGAYVLRTSHADWDIETVLRTYWRITDIEATFKSLKSELGLRPIWHQLDRRIAAHLLIAVLAYHAVHLIRTRLAAQGIHKCWASIRESMRTWVRITTRLRQIDGTLIVDRQGTRPAAEVAEISSVAGVKPAIHRTRTRLTSSQSLTKCEAMLESGENTIALNQRDRRWGQRKSANLGHQVYMPVLPHAIPRLGRTRQSGTQHERAWIFACSRPDVGFTEMCEAAQYRDAELHPE